LVYACKFGNEILNLFDRLVYSQFMHNYILPLKEFYIETANPQNAAAMQKYMKDNFVYFGIKTPERKLIYKEFIALQGLPSYEELPEIIRSLWQQPEREYQYFAIELLEKFTKKFDNQIINLLEEMITQKSWWDSVDLLASHHVADYFKKYPENIQNITAQWMVSQNMWLQRTCIIFQLFYKKQTDTALLFEHIRCCADSKEFFIQKAIGWALRQYARTDSQMVLKFVEENTLKPLSKREALKHF
jgi:3-methyladenine DNA glycosylase AlkD